MSISLSLFLSLCVCKWKHMCVQCKHTAKRIPFAKRIVLSLSQFSFATTKTFENFRGIVYLYVHLLSWGYTSYIIDMAYSPKWTWTRFCLCPTQNDSTYRCICLLQYHIAYKLRYAFVHDIIYVPYVRCTLNKHKYMTSEAFFLSLSLFLFSFLDCVFSIAYNWECWLLFMDLSAIHDYPVHILPLPFAHEYSVLSISKQRYILS